MGKATVAEPKSRTLVRWLREGFHIGLAVLFVLAARSSLADHYTVPTGSMEFTLMPGDRVFVDKRAYGLRVPFLDQVVVEGERPRRGEVVVFDSPEDGTRLIKRLVAVAGDLVMSRGGHLTVNGEALAREDDEAAEQFGDRVARLNLAYGGGPDFGPITVPEGNVLVMGDSRGNSRDSRIFGLVSEDSLYAKAVAVYHRRGEGFLWKGL